MPNDATTLSEEVRQNYQEKCLCKQTATHSPLHTAAHPECGAVLNQAPPVCMCLSGFFSQVCIKVTVINFTVTMFGLEDQLLGAVVKKERPDIETKKNRLVVSMASDKRQLQDLEDKILKLLSESTGNILDDEELIRALGEVMQHLSASYDVVAWCVCVCVPGVGHAPLDQCMKRMYALVNPTVVKHRTTHSHAIPHPHVHAFHMLQTLDIRSMPVYLYRHVYTFAYTKYACISV
jgi:hypothetical protein